MCYLDYLQSLDDFDYNRMLRRPEFYFFAECDLKGRIWIQKVDNVDYDCWTVKSTCVYPRNAQYNLITGNIYCYGIFTDFRDAVISWINCVIDISTQLRSYNTMSVFVAQLSCQLEFVRLKCQVSYCTTDYPYMHLDDVLDKTLSRKKILYRGNVDVAKVKFISLLRSFFDFVIEL